nr:extensin-like [Procambarus clarkii]
MASCKLVLLTLVAGVALADPQYNYQRPPPPSGLYETPVAPPPRPPPRPAPPPRSRPPPPQTYSPPPKTYNPPPQASNIRPQTYKSPATPGMEGMPYDFQWGVEDRDSGNAFSHVENSDGRTTQGEYRVLMPDGRTQVVKFFDNGGGFNAEVTYV